MLKVLFYVPNLIGYLRLFLIFLAWCNIDSPRAFLFLYVPSILLDGLDGYAARKLNQISVFGAWLDVVVDVIGRGMLWSNISKFGYAVPAWEWIVFVGNHARADTGQWKEKFNNAPLIVKKVTENGFRTAIGTLTVCGIHVLPIWLYMEIHLVKLTALTPAVSFCIFWTLICGRLLGFIAETWCVCVHILHLVDEKGRAP